MVVSRLLSLEGEGVGGFQSTFEDAHVHRAYLNAHLPLTRHPCTHALVERHRPVGAVQKEHPYQVLMVRLPPSYQRAHHSERGLPYWSEWQHLKGCS